LDRARNLVSLYSLEEKINQTSSTAPGVERLGIPPYQWWSEGLHGIAGPFTNFSDEGDYSYSTSFPQPILMGAAFDDQLITDVGKVISIEARAFNNANRTGLDFWTPNINPFKDPRWGRGQGEWCKMMHKMEFSNLFCRDTWRRLLPSRVICTRFDQWPAGLSHRPVQACNSDLQALCRYILCGTQNLR
jgi:hypothetical protein